MKFSPYKKLGSKYFIPYISPKPTRGPFFIAQMATFELPDHQGEDDGCLDGGRSGSENPSF